MENQPNPMQQNMENQPNPMRQNSQEEPLPEVYVFNCPFCIAKRLDILQKRIDRYSAIIAEYQAEMADLKLTGEQDNNHQIMHQNQQQQQQFEAQPLQEEQQNLNFF